MTGLWRGSVFALAFALGACGGPVTTVPVGGAGLASEAGIAQRPERDVDDAMLYSFKGQPDGASPQAGLTVVNGNLFGVTFYGGAYANGTVFEMNPFGRERVLYSFRGGPDGQNPYTTLTYLGGELYGNTTGGGDTGCQVSFYGSGCGTIFEVTRGGDERVLYRFKGGPDGSTPQVGMISVNGLLYGTTAFGGGSPCIRDSYRAGCGTVFDVTPSGNAHLLYRFKGGADGAYPLATLNDVNGVLYGTTFEGGTHNDGTVFALTAAGKERIVYSFTGDADGKNPWASLTWFDGAFFGTTLSGGGSGCRGRLGCGTVFWVTTSGVQRVIHRFGGGGDGTNPETALTALSGALYGTTLFGGGNGCGGAGCGTVFRITPSGAYSIIHRFGGGSHDGARPEGNLVEYGGLLYGTTLQGGPKNAGTVFVVKP